MNFGLELEEIKAICGKIVYNRAMDMYLRNKVRSMKINENSINTLSITGIVQSAYDVNNYRISILINKKNLKMYPNCGCDDFSK